MSIKFSKKNFWGYWEFEPNVRWWRYIYRVQYFFTNLTKGPVPRKLNVINCKSLILVASLTKTFIQIFWTHQYVNIFCRLDHRDPSQRWWRSPSACPRPRPAPSCRRCSHWLDSGGNWGSCNQMVVLLFKRLQSGNYFRCLWSWEEY